MGFYRIGPQSWVFFVGRLQVYRSFRRYCAELLP